MENIFRIIFLNWKTTLFGLAFVMLSIMLWLDKITITEYCYASGILAGILLISSKDNSPRNIKPGENPGGSPNKK